MIYNSAQEQDLLENFISHVGEERLSSFREYEHRPKQISDHELFVLFSFQQYQVANRPENPHAQETLQAIHQNIQNMSQAQIGQLTNPLSDAEWQTWSDHSNYWINSMYWFNRFLSKLCASNTLSEYEADNMLLVRYFTGLYYEVGANAYNASKAALGDAYREGSEWYDQLNMNMTNLSLNLREVFEKRGELYNEAHQRFVSIKIEILGLAIEEIQKNVGQSNLSDNAQDKQFLQSLLRNASLFLLEAYRDAHGAPDAITLSPSDVSKATGIAVATSPQGELPEGVTHALYMGFVALTELEKAHNTEVPYFS